MIRDFLSGRECINLVGGIKKKDTEWSRSRTIRPTNLIRRDNTSKEENGPSVLRSTYFPVYRHVKRRRRVKEEVSSGFLLQ